MEETTTVAQTLGTHDVLLDQGNTALDHDGNVLQNRIGKCGEYRIANTDSADGIIIRTVQEYGG